MTASAARPIEKEARLCLIQSLQVVGRGSRPDLGEHLRIFLTETVSAHRGPHQYQFGDSRGMVKRQVDGEPTAQRAADHVRRFQPELVDEGDHIADRRPAPRRQLGIPEAAHVRPDDIELLGKFVRLRLPHPRVSDSCMEHQDREAGALAAVVDAGAVDVDDHVNAVSSALNFSSVSSSSRANRLTLRSGVFGNTSTN